MLYTFRAWVGIAAATDIVLGISVQSDDSQQSSCEQELFSHAWREHDQVEFRDDYDRATLGTVIQHKNDEGVCDCGYAWSENEVLHVCPSTSERRSSLRRSSLKLTKRNSSHKTKESLCISCNGSDRMFHRSPEKIALADTFVPKCICGEDMHFAEIGSKEMEFVDERYQAMGFEGVKCSKCDAVDPCFQFARYVCSKNGAHCKYDLCRECGEELAVSVDVRSTKGLESKKDTGYTLSSHGGLKNVTGGSWADTCTTLKKYAGETVDKRVSPFYITKMRSTHENNDDVVKTINNANDLDAAAESVAKKNVVLNLRRLQKGDEVELKGYSGKDANKNKMLGTLINQNFEVGDEVRFDFGSRARKYTAFNGKEREVIRGEKGIVTEKKDRKGLKFCVEMKDQVPITLVDIYGEDLVLARPSFTSEPHIRDWRVRFDKQNQSSDNIWTRNYDQKDEEQFIIAPEKRFKKIKSFQPLVGEILEEDVCVTLPAGKYYDQEFGACRTFDTPVEASIIEFDETTNLYQFEIEMEDDEEIYVEVDVRDVNAIIQAQQTEKEQVVNEKPLAAQKKEKRESEEETNIQKRKSSIQESEQLEQKYSKAENQVCKYDINDDVYFWDRRKNCEVKAIVIVVHDDDDYEIELENGSEKNANRDRLRPVPLEEKFNTKHEYTVGDQVFYWDRRKEREFRADIVKDYDGEEYLVVGPDGEQVDASYKRLRPRQFVFGPE